MAATTQSVNYGERPEIFAYHRLGRVLSFSFNEEMADRIHRELLERRQAVEEHGEQVTAALFKFENTLRRLLDRPAPMNPALKETTAA